jgi:diguanylate cyclase (GGDEF)-like protein
MAHASRINPIKSKLGREIYALALLLASAPIILIGSISLVKIESGYRASAEENLANSAKAYGELVHERLKIAEDVANRIAASVATTPHTTESSRQFAGYVVKSANGDELTRTPEFVYPANYVESARRPGRIEVGPPGDMGSLTLTRVFDDRTFTGIIDAAYLWGDRSDFPYAIDFCVLALESTEPLFCSSALPSTIAQAAIESTSTRGTFEWEQKDDGFLTTYWELFTEPSVGGPTLRIVASQPTSIALAAVRDFRSVYAPGLLVTIAFTLLASGFYSRRALVPLAQLLAITKKYAKRNFDAKVEFRRDDEFRDVALALKGMASDLKREFETREALAKIDEAILADAGREDLCQGALDRALACTPFDKVELVLYRQNAKNAVFVASRAENTPALFSIAKGDVTTHKAAQALSRLKITSRSADREPSQGTAQTYSAPITVNHNIVGKLTGSCERHSPDSLGQEHLGQFADRVAIGLEYIQKSEELRRRAYFDELTGLPNRESCLLRIDQAIDLAKHNNHCVALMFVDLDEFKSVNDSLGHVAGDELIKQAASRLTRCVGYYGFTARLGGDEFAVLVSFSEGEVTHHRIADAIIKALSEPFAVAGSEVILGASVGTAQFPKDGDNQVELLRKADAAMYRAKSSGRSQKADYSMTMGIRIDTQFRIETQLGRALERDELFLVYQPQVDLRTSQAGSAEALLRWRQSEDGHISPAVFIPIAEQSGAIIQIGNWVLYNACAQLRAWQDSGANIHRIAVNVSAKQIRDERFISHVEACMREFEIGEGELELELTESLMADNDRVTKALAYFKQLGIAISIDDFGTGYSSLSYLRSLAFDTVKIDQSFVRNLPQDNEAAAIVHAVVAMCHTLGKSVVAEGIETDTQLSYLSSARVDIGQGYFLGKPMLPEDYLSWLKAREASAGTVRHFARS